MALNLVKLKGTELQRKEGLEGLIGKMSQIDLSAFQSLGNTVDPRMFGTNMLSHQNIPGSSFTSALEMIGGNALRYPGGTITEREFSVRNPNATIGTEGSALVPLDEFMHYAQSLRLPAIIVLPTRQLLIGQPDPTGTIVREVDTVELQSLRSFVRDLLYAELARAEDTSFFSISAFEIGNEYWASGDMTSSEYGTVLNAVSIMLKEVLTEVVGNYAHLKVGIVGQMGSPWDRTFDPGGLYAALSSDTPKATLDRLGITQADLGSDGTLLWDAKLRLSNLDILKHLTSDAKDALSGLVEHFYYNQSSLVLANTSSDRTFIDQDYRFWQQAGLTGKELHITEWNVSGHNSEEFGLRAAGVILHQFSNMIRMGVDSAYSWALQHNTATSLAGSPTGEARLTASSLVLAHLKANTIGKELADLCTDFIGIETNLFIDGSEAALYVTSRSYSTQQIYLNLGSAFSDSHIRSIQIVAVDMSTADSLHRIGGVLTRVAPYAEYDASAQITSVDCNTALQGGVVRITLRPFEVAMLVINRDAISGTSDGDYLIGSSGGDFILGLSGDDTLVGSSGNDTIEGGLGLDSAVFSQNLNMVVDLRNGEASGEGIDILNGIDRVVTGDGRDYLSGNGHPNSFVSGSGNDTMFGGGGSDTLAPGRGNDHVYGGSGVDTVLLITASNLTVNLTTTSPQVTGDGADRFISIENVVTGSGFDKLVGNSLPNRMNSGAGNDVLDGRGGNDHLLGELGNDRILGRSGSDTLAGLGGQDTLSGGIGSDVLSGGIGRDQFVFATGDGNDRIVDFEVGVDVLAFSGSLVARDVSFRGVMGSTLVEGDGFSILLRGVGSQEFSTGDMVFL